MARTKKVMNEDGSVINDENTVEYLMKMVQDLQKQMGEMNQNNKNREEKENIHIPNVLSGNQVDVNRWVTVIHLLENSEGLTTHIELTNRKIDFRKFGDTIRLRLTDFEELVYKYSSWFENNMIAITKADEDLAVVFNINYTDNIPINSAILNKLHNMSDDELSRLWNTVSKNLQDLIIKRWAIGYFEPDPETGKHPKNRAYAELKRIKFLNDLAGGKLDRILEDLNYREYENKKGD